MSTKPKNIRLPTVADLVPDRPPRFEDFALPWTRPSGDVVLLGAHGH